MPDLKARLQRTLGDAYALERELEAGGMARVFVARDLNLGRQIVVKTLGDDVGASVSAERFRREIRLAASLQQANIVPVHSAGDVDGVPYYTMPFVDGETLRAHLNTRGALEPAAAIHILRDVARALAFAHDRGIVHRDIKPENILLSGSTAVVTDFGIAKAVEASHSQAAQTTLTQLGTLLGTPMYLSPEQAAGDPLVDHRADIYSLGIVAYEMLSGARPFMAATARELLAAHVHEAPPPLIERRTGIPPRLAALVMRCLEKDPACRPQDAAELLTALDSAMAHDAGTSGTPSIAVVPFANLSPDPADSYFADGLTDEIITDLAGVKGLRVIARTAMIRYKGTDKEPAAVARELRVRHVLDGSVRRAADSLRLTVRLLDTETGSTIWSDKLTGEVSDVFAMQERVSRTIVDALRVRLTPREEKRLEAQPIRDVRAYEAYLQARQLMYTFTVASLDRARTLLEAAHARVGDDARLIAALGGVYLNYVETAQVDRDRHLREAQRYVDALAALDSDSFDRHFLEGWLRWKRGHIREAIVSLSSAHNIEPNSADAAIYLSLAYLYAGQNDNARELAGIVVTLDPLTPLFQCMPGFCDVMAGRAKAGVAPYRRFLEMDSANPVAATFLTWALVEAGEVAAAVGVADRLACDFPDTVFGHLGAAYAHALRGDVANGMAAITPAIRDKCRSNESMSRTLASIFTLLNSPDDAVDALRDAVALGLAHYPYLSKDARVLRRLRGHAGYEQLLEVVQQRWERGGTSEADLTERSVTAAHLRRSPAGPLPQTHARRPSLAVLPFANLSPEPDNDFFAEGITDDLIAQVAKVASLRVIARTSVMRYRGAQDAARSAARDLHVDAVVEGTVRRAGTRVRIVAQLVDAATEAPIWSETYDRNLDDIFSVQTEVATSVAAALKATLSPVEQRRMARQPTRDARAYDLYLLGRQLFTRRTADSITAAIDHFEQAIHRDPGFAGAYAGLADAYVFAGLGYAPLPVHDAFAKARDAAARAIALDEASPDALCAVGISAMHGDWDIARARAAFERALTVSPSHAAAHQMLGWCTFAVGDYAAAVGPLRHARELDPLNLSLIVEEAWPYMYAELYEMAMEYFQRAIAIDPGFGLGHYNLGAALEGLGRHAEALDAYHRALACMGPTPWVLANIARTHLALGNVAKCDEMLAALHEQGRNGVAVWLSIAIVLDAMDRPEDAADALNHAIDAHEPFVWALGLEAWLRFPHARRLPRFQLLLERVGARPHDVAGQRALLLAHG